MAHSRLPLPATHGSRPERDVMRIKVPDCARERFLVIDDEDTSSTTLRKYKARTIRLSSSRFHSNTNFHLAFPSKREYAPN
jgi:hypothetical protein